MTVLLALDTTAGQTSMAVAAEGVVRACAITQRRQGHSEALFAGIDGVLAAAGLSKADLTAVAVTRGPGAFTGLRVGLATAKGIAMALGIPAVGVSTLAALTAGAGPFPGAVVAALDARKQQVYATVTDGRTGAVLVAERAMTAVDLLETLPDYGAVWLTGSGVTPCEAVFRAALGDRLFVAPAERWGVDPAVVARLGFAALEAGQGVDAAHLAPVYLRASEAEEKRAQQGK